MIPSHIKKYFWEIDTKKLDLKKRKVYILKRLLEYGDPRAISWAWKTFAKKDWNESLKSREISPITKDFWKSLLVQKNLKQKTGHRSV